jgi:hypothetical protein
VKQQGSATLPTKAARWFGDFIQFCLNSPDAAVLQKHCFSAGAGPRFCLFFVVFEIVGVKAGIPPFFALAPYSPGPVYLLSWSVQARGNAKIIAHSQRI